MIYNGDAECGSFNAFMLIALFHAAYPHKSWNWHDRGQNKKEHPGLRTGDAAAAQFSQLTNIGEEKSQKCNNNDTGGHKKTDRQVSEEKRGDTKQDNHDILSKSLSAPTKDDHVTNDNFTAAAKSGKKHQDEGPAIMSAASSLMIEGGIHALIHNNKTATTGAPEPKNVPPLHTPGNDIVEKDLKDLGKAVWLSLWRMMAPLHWKLVPTQQ